MPHAQTADPKYKIREISNFSARLHRHYTPKSARILFKALPARTHSICASL